jgi:deoxyguanosine kinase
LYFQTVKLNRYYLGLGSNEEARLTHIQTAIFELNEQQINVLSCSTLYENDAQGFSGKAFYNACIAVDTALSSHELLERCLSLELSHGRARTSTSTNYQDRPLDIDLLLGPEPLNDADLTLPHPRMAQRRFVLEPLRGVAAALNDKQHLDEIELLLSQCRDRSTLNPVNISLLCSLTDLWENSEMVVIEGCIGVGKTSLCNLLAARYSIDTHLERFESNPYLSDFYQDPEAYALPTELHFLADRQQALHELNEKKGIVADYHISKSALFAELNLNPQDLALFNRFYSWSRKLTKTPALYVLLDAPVQQLEKRIRQRARSYESQIDSTYLERIRLAYLKGHASEVAQLVIDTSALDFVHKQADFDRICTEINRLLLAQRLTNHKLA